MEEWKSIPGMPLYEMNLQDLSVKNVKMGKYMTITDNRVGLRNNKGHIRISIPRLLFCVQNGIEPERLTRSTIIVLEDGKPVVYERNSYMSKKIKAVYCEKSNKNPLESYLNAQAYINIVIDAMKTKDYTLVAKSLYDYKGVLIGRIMKNNIMHNKDDATELVSIVIENTLSRMISGTIVLFPFQYMYSAAKRMAAAVHKKDKETKDYIRNNYTYRKYYGF